MKPALWKMANGMMLATLMLLLTGCQLGRHYDAALVLQDFAAVDGTSRLKQTTAAPQRQSVSYTVAGRTHRADLYLPGSLEGCTLYDPLDNPQAIDEHNKHCPRAAIVAVPGAVPQSKDDPRFVAFATTLARARFAVLAPDLDGFRQLRIRPSNIREVADAFAYIASRPELAPDGRVGMFAFSYSVGPAILAALEGDIREKVRFVVGLGGYHDLPQAMRFFTTGQFEYAGKWHHLTPDDTGKMVLLYSSLDYLAEEHGEARDRGIFDQMVALRSQDSKADLTALAAQLSTDAWTVYALAVNSDPARFPELLTRLPAAMQTDIKHLDLARHNLKLLKARLILVHGKNDNLIPYPESLALAAAAPENQSRVTLIHRVLGHVDLSISHLFSWRFWSEDIPDLWRLWRIIDLLLAQREEAT